MMQENFPLEPTGLSVSRVWSTPERGVCDRILFVERPLAPGMVQLEFAVVTAPVLTARVLGAWAGAGW